MDSPSPSVIASRLLKWAVKHGRDNLPWQTDPTPYRVWVSEVMLQQTQVATALPYYQRFITRFPDVDSLAAASLDDVLHLWAGLGYYARGRNLHRAAGIVVQECIGYVPSEIKALQALPGIGRSTAGAILALSWGLRHPILDSNARRVLARPFAIEGDPAAAETVKQLWAVADACTPQSRVADYTQAMMDLGATVCLRKQPHCETCPLKQICTAYQQDRQEHLPSPRRRARRPHRVAFALEIHDTTNSLLLQKRPEEGLWGGLWSLPQFDAADEAAEWLENQFPGVEIREGQLQHHAFTHYDLDLQILCIRLEESRKEVLDCVWYDSQEVPDIGLTKVVTGLV